MNNERKFKAALAAIGISQNSFALTCGIEPSTVTRWLKNDRVPPWAWYAIKGIEKCEPCIACGCKLKEVGE